MGVERGKRMEERVESAKKIATGNRFPLAHASPGLPQRFQL